MNKRKSTVKTLTMQKTKSKVSSDYLNIGKIATQPQFSPSSRGKNLGMSGGHSRASRRITNSSDESRASLFDRASCS